jgi:ankyrin repeat protein
MKKRDENGQVPLHRALRDNVTLGSIKLIVKRNPSVILTPDNNGALPLHVAIQHHDSPAVVDYLVGLDPNTLAAVDREGNTALHLACRGAKYDTIALLLDKYGAVSVSQGNVCNKLPIHLLFESGSVPEREDDTKYLESIFRLLRFNPETVMVSEDAKLASIPQVGRPSRSGKKRKYCA